MTKLTVADSYLVPWYTVQTAVKVVSEAKSARPTLYLTNIEEYSDTTRKKVEMIILKLRDTVDFSDADYEERFKKKRIKKILKTALDEVYKEFTHTEETIKQLIISDIVSTMVGLGKIDILLNDDMLEEISITAHEYVRITHRKWGSLMTDIHVPNSEMVNHFASLFARSENKPFSLLFPLLDATSYEGYRVNAVINALSPKGSNITIRKQSKEPYSIIDMIEFKSCSTEVYAILWMSIEYGQSVLISGGTAAGKTTFLNVLCSLILFSQKVVSIEDTLELKLPPSLFWIPLLTRKPNSEGKGEVTMYDLLINSLRMRPDVIAFGEVRRENDARELFEAMHTGHTVFATLHANSLGETIQRLVHHPINVPPAELGALGLTVVCWKNSKKGYRRVKEVGEFIVREKGNELEVVPNVLYKYDPKDDTILKSSKSMSFFEKIKDLTGMTDKEIQNDLSFREDVLRQMQKENLRKVHQVGSLMKIYYSDMELFKAAMARKNLRSLLEPAK